MRTRTPRIHPERFNRREAARSSVAPTTSHYVWEEENGTFSVVSPEGQRMETGHTDEAWAEEVAAMFDEVDDR